MKAILTILTMLAIVFPDGTRGARWFSARQARTPRAERTQYIITEHGVRQDSTILQTSQIQAVIDLAASNGL